jgi:hypothetical protein
MIAIASDIASSVELSRWQAGERAAARVPLSGWLPSSSIPQARRPAPRLRVGLSGDEPTPPELRPRLTSPRCVGASRPRPLPCHPPIARGQISGTPVEMTSGFAIPGWLARTASPYAQHSDPQRDTGTPVFRKTRFGFLPIPPRDNAAVIGLWLVPSTSTGGLSRRAADHAGRTDPSGITASANS